MNDCLVEEETQGDATGEVDCPCAFAQADGWELKVSRGECVWVDSYGRFDDRLIIRKSEGKQRHCREIVGEELQVEEHGDLFYGMRDRN